MKNVTLVFSLCIALLTGCSQTKTTFSPNKEAITAVQTIFDDYVNHPESTDSKSNKALMTKSLKSIDKVTDPDELALLLNVWMYYDPTDYSCQPLVYTILENSKPYSIAAVQHRIAHKKEWENETAAPYSELIELLLQLTTEKF